MQDVDCSSKGFVRRSRHQARVVGVAAGVLMAVGRVSTAATPEPEAQPPVPFQPGDISIGEPIALPSTQPIVAQPSGIRTATPPVGAVAATPGWLGMSVAESTVPGRWTIVELAPAGPAAAAGLLMGDELRGVNGKPVASADQVSEVLTAITAGQQVRLNVARGERVSDVEVVARPRPSSPVTTAAIDPPAAATAPLAAAASAPSPPVTNRGWQSTEPQNTVAAPAPDGVSTVSVLTSPAPHAPAAAAVPPAAPAPTQRGRTALGVRTVPIDRDIQERFRLPHQAGAYVVGVVGDLPASKAGIPPGSVIVSLADRPVRSPQELTQLVVAGPLDRPLPLHYVLPGGTERRADVVLQSLELPLEQALVGEPALQPAQAPTLEQSPGIHTSRRQESAGDGEASELRREVSRLRTLLEALERRLERIAR